MTTLSINPETKVGELLEAYPQLEETLIAMAPAFARLRNPILRRTVARVATLTQAARVGGIDVREMVVRLRTAAGQSGDPVVSGGAGSTEVSDVPPDWFDESRVAARFDADEILARGEHPLGAVQGAATGLARGEQLLLTSGFFPAPLVDALRTRGFMTASFAAPGGRIRTAICHGPNRG